MNGKKGVGLSISFVVVTILALMVLGVALWFILKATHITLPETPECLSDPDSDRPLIIPSTDLKIGRESGITVCAFNRFDSAINTDELPSISCTGTNIELIGSGISIEVGESGIYRMLAIVDENAQAKTYPCTVSLRDATTSVRLKVVSP